MNEQEQAIADKIYAAVQHDINFTERTLQSKSFRVGVSDLGFCSERTRRMLDQQTPGHIDMLPAWIGTAVGKELERVQETIWPDGIFQSEVSVTLTGSRGTTYTLNGHPDVVLPEGIVLDNKTSFGLTYVERDGADQQKQIQRHLYAIGAHQAGMFNPDVALEDVRVGNVWMDRGGVDRRVHVQIEKFDPEWARFAAEWIDDVVYAWVHEEEARKEPPRQMCAKACGFFDVCRARDTDVEGFISDPGYQQAVDIYIEGRDMEKKGKRLKDEAKVLLNGVSGSTGTHVVRHTWRNSRGGGYWAIDINELKQSEVPV